MAKKKNKQGEHSAVADFFGDSDFDWDDEFTDPEMADAADEAPSEAPPAAPAPAPAFAEPEPAPAFADPEPASAPVLADPEPASAPAFADPEPAPAPVLAEPEPVPAPVLAEPPAVPLDSFLITPPVAPIPEPSAGPPPVSEPDIAPPVADRAPPVVPPPVASEEVAAPSTAPVEQPLSVPPPSRPPVTPAVPTGFGTLLPKQPKAVPSSAHRARHALENIGLPTPPELWREAIERISEKDTSAERQAAEAHVRYHWLNDAHGTLAAFSTVADGWTADPALALELASTDEEQAWAWRTLAKHSTGPASADAWMHVADLQPGEELAALEAALAEDPSHVNLLRRFLRVAPPEKQTAALQSLADLLELPAASDLIRRLVQCKMAQGQTEDARELCAHALEASPDHPGLQVLAQTLGLAGPTQSNPTGWSSLLEARASGLDREAWLSAVRLGDMDAASEWWTALRAQSAPELAEVIEASAPLLDPKLVPWAQFLAALAWQKAGKLDRAFAMFQASGLEIAQPFVAPLVSELTLNEEQLAQLAQTAQSGRPEAVFLWASALDGQEGQEKQSLAAWRLAVDVGAPGAAYGLLGAARRIADPRAEIEALEALAQSVGSLGRAAACRVRAAMWARERLHDPAEAAERLKVIEHEPTGLVLDLLVEDLLAMGELRLAADALAQASTQGSGVVAKERALEAAWLLRGQDRNKVESLLDFVCSDEGAPPPFAALIRSLLPGDAQSRRAALAQMQTPDAAAALWLSSWLDGEDHPVADDVVARPMLLLLHAAAATEAAERASRLEQIGGSGRLRVARAVDAWLEVDAVHAATLVDRLPEDASPALARLALRANRLDRAAKLASTETPAARRWYELFAGVGAEGQRAWLEAEPEASLDQLAWLWFEASDPGLRRDVLKRLHALELSKAWRSGVVGELAHDAALAGSERLEIAAEALTLRPQGHDIFEFLRRAAITDRKVDDLRALYASSRAEDHVGLAESLALAGCYDPEAWRAGSGYYASAGYEVALLRTKSWKELFDTWSERIEQLGSGQSRDLLEARRRWLLANRLADTDAAYELYSRLHLENPEDRSATEGLARVAGARGETEVALEHLQTLLTGAEDAQEVARLTGRMAEVLLRAGREDEARVSWLNALDVQPDNNDALEGLRGLAEHREQWGELEDVLRRQASILAGEPRVEILKARARLFAERIADPARADEAWAAVLAEKPSDLEATRARYQLARAGHDLTRVLDTGRALVRLVGADERFDLLVEIAKRCEKDGNKREAVEFYELALKEPHQSLEAADALKQLYRSLGDTRGVLRAILASADTLKDDPAAAAERYVEAARVELEQHFDRQAAHVQFAQALACEPTNVAALRFEATWFFDAGDETAALALFERLQPIVSSWDLDDPDVSVEAVTFYFRLGQLRRKRQPQQAIEAWHQALRLNPQHLPSLQAIGPLLAERGAWDELGEVYRRILQITGGQGSPEEMANVYAMLGRVELSRKDYDKAQRRFRKSLEVMPDCISALEGMGELHTAREEWQEALVAYNEVIRAANPDTAESAIVHAYLAKGQLLDAHMGRVDKAREHYAGCLMFRAGEPHALVRMMELSIRDASWDQAAKLGLEALEDAERLGGRTLAATAWLGVALARQSHEDTEGAREALSQARHFDPSLEDVAIADIDAVKAQIRERLR